MRFIRENSGEWGLGDLNPFEFALLSQLPTVADPGSHRGAKDRLYPSPISEKNADGEEEFVADWKEYVSVDQAQQFDSALQLFRSDLASVVETSVDLAADDDEDFEEEEEESEEEEREELMATRFELTLSDDRAWPWYSALNQARIVLEEKFKLHEDEDFDEDDVSEDALAMIEGRWRANLHSQFYGVIQDWLIQGVLQAEVEDIPDEAEGERGAAEDEVVGDWNDLLDLDFGDEEE